MRANRPIMSSLGGEVCPGPVGVPGSRSSSCVPRKVREFEVIVPAELPLEDDDDEAADEGLAAAGVCVPPLVVPVLPVELVEEFFFPIIPIKAGSIAPAICSII